MRTALALAVFAAALSGCICIPTIASQTHGSLLPDDRLAAIQPGRTTRAEVLEWFGPPLAFARDGAIGPAPDVAYRWSGWSEAQASSFFAKFPAGAAGPGDLVYLYQQDEYVFSSASLHYAFVDPLALVVLSDLRPGPASTKETSALEQREDRLWILIDATTNVVKAHVLERLGPPRASTEGPDPGVVVPP
ncbi:MAG TPA: hypothetical protein VFM93_12285 [Candidatus Limnocylindria bacterium]|nr:hypothetical protein [Candidatus Limnocylindria bacterium]